MLNSNILGERLRGARKKQRLTQEQAANQLEANVTTLGNYERGLREPPVSLVVAASRLYQVDLVWMLTGDQATAAREETGGYTDKEQRLLELLRRSPESIGPLTMAIQAMMDNAGD